MAKQKCVVCKTAEDKQVKLTVPEIEMLIDAADRMKCDDVWDEYSYSDENALQSAADKLGLILSQLGPN